MPAEAIAPRQDALRSPLTDAYLARLRSEFPKLRLVRKDEDFLSSLIHNVLFGLTFGGQNGYRTRFVTVIGYGIYLPTKWDQLSDIERLIILRHERVHLIQRRRLTMPLMAFLYLVPFFPIGLAYGRARLEWEAYTETLRATAELQGLAAARDVGLRRHIIRRFVGPEYGWMWPFPRVVGGWYDRVIIQIESTPPAENEVEHH